MSGGLVEVLAKRLGDPHRAVKRMLREHDGMVPSECRCLGCDEQYAEPTRLWTEAAEGLAAHQWQMLLADVVTAHLAARLEEAKADVGERMLLEAMDGDFLVGAGRGVTNAGEDVGLSRARNAEVAYWARNWMLRFVGDALGLDVASEVPDSRSERRSGGNGPTMQGERVGGEL